MKKVQKEKGFQYTRTCAIPSAPQVIGSNDKCYQIRQSGCGEYIAAERPLRGSTFNWFRKRKITAVFILAGTMEKCSWALRFDIRWPR